MFADKYGSQATLEAFGTDALDEARRQAARERKARTEALVDLGLSLADVERAAYGGSLVPLQEWLEYSPDRQTVALNTRLDLLRDRIDTLEGDPPDERDTPPPFGYDHSHLENERRWGYD